jgi:hypothetical protein
MALESLTFKEVKARPVICKLTRPAVARIGSMTHIPIILIDLFTEEGVVGRSYLKPYLPKAMKYLIPGRFMTEVKPYRLLNDLGRETVTAETDLVHLRGATRPPRTPQGRSTVTMPARFT